MVAFLYCLSTATRSLMMSQSFGLSSYFWSLKALLLVMSSIAVQYWSEKRNKSYVEFHLVATLCGMSRHLSLYLPQMRFQAGRASVRLTTGTGLTVVFLIRVDWVRVRFQDPIPKAIPRPKGTVYGSDTGMMYRSLH
jgi:hypothetical protein